MKTSTLIIALFLVTWMTGVTFPVFADCITPIRITTIADGDWTDPSIWDAGVIPTQCDTADILHHVILDNYIQIGDPFKGGKVHVFATASLVGTSKSITLTEGGNLVVDGILNIKQVTVAHSSASVVVSGSITVYDHFNNEGSVVNLGSIFVIGNKNYNNYGSGFTLNNGFMQLGNDFTNSNRASVTNNGTISIADEFINSALISGNCGLFIVGDDGQNTTAGVVAGTVDICVTNTWTNSGFVAGSVTFCNPCGTPLETRLIDFSGHRIQNRAELQWTATSGHENVSFVLQKSFDQVAWTTIADFETRQSEDNEQTFLHEDELQGLKTHFYRILETEAGAIRFISKIQEVVPTEEGDFNVQVYPNPARSNEAIHLNLTPCDDCRALIGVYDIHGALIYKQYLDTPNQGNLLLNLPDVSPGLYTIKVASTNGDKDIRKLMIQE